MKTQHLFLLSVYALLTLLALIPLHGSAAVYTLYSDDISIAADRPLPAESSLATDMQRAAQRTRPVVLTPRLTNVAHDAPDMAIGDTLILPLFDAQILTAVIDRIDINVMGTITVRARVPEHTYSYLLLSHNNGHSFMTVSLPEQQGTYAIVYDPTIDAHVLCDYTKDDLDILEPGPPLIPPLPDERDDDIEDKTTPTDTPPVSRGLGPSDPATLDVMVVYTPAARTWAGGTANMNNVIANAMSRAQTAHDNSGTLISMPLVHAAEVSYTESGSSNTDLSRLQDTSDGYMDEVHTWRDNYAADFVALFTQVDDTGGLGYLLNTKNGLPAWAFSISRVQQVGWTYTLVHEIGHNMGAHHHKQQTVQPGPTSFYDWSTNTWSAGWRWTGNDSGKYCSIMTYESGTYFSDGVTHTRVAHFSNPNINYQGQPTGHATDGDNVRTFNLLKHIFAAYRSGNVPHIAITNNAYAIPYNVTQGTLAGTNAHVTSPMWWSNTLVVGEHAFSHAGNSFSVMITNLQVGNNVISIYGTNSAGVGAYASRAIYRRTWAETYPQITSSALTFPASGDVLYADMTFGPTSIIWNISQIFDATDGPHVLITRISTHPKNNPANYTDLMHNILNPVGQVSISLPPHLISLTEEYVIRFDIENSAHFTNNRVFVDAPFSIIPEPVGCLIFYGALWMLVWRARKIHSL